MAIVKDEEEQKGQGTSQALGQGMTQPNQQTSQPEQPQEGSSAPATIGGSAPQAPAQTAPAAPKQQKAGTGTFANLKSYLQAAQGGGQQRVAQAATQQVQRLGAGAQKGLQQAQQAFGKRMESGSLKGMETASQEAKDIIGAARSTTYQAPQQPTPTEPQSYFDRTFNLNEAGLAKLGDKASSFQEELNAINRRMLPMDRGPGSANEAASKQQQKDREALYEKYGLNAVPAALQPTTPAPQPQQQYFTPEQTQRFAEIINAQYQGPASLQQAGLYEQAAQKARTAQEAAQKTQTALGREQLLRDVFGRTRDYGRGVSKLDALLLNTSQQGVKQLQEQAQPAAQAQEALQAAQNVSANEAAQRQAAIEGIRSGARQEFTGARAAEEQATEKRIDDLIKTPVLDEKGQPQLKADGTPMTEWDRLPEFFRQSLASKTSPQWQLSAEEAAILGVGAGEGLYNIRPEDIRTTQADRARLITRNELARQQALAQLAERDISRELQKDLAYTDMEKAGTQDLASSLDVESFRRLLDESQAGFKTAAQEADITGTGKKKVSRGNWAGKKTKTYHASVGGNVADMLREAGYDVGAEGEGTRSLLTDRDLLNRYLGATSTNRDVEANIGGSALEGTAAGAGTGASIGAMTGTGPVGAGVGAAVGGMIGGMAGANTLDATQYYTDLAKEMEDKLGIKGLGAAGQAVQDVRQGAGNVYGETYGKALDLLGLGDVSKGIKGMISGIDTGAMKAYGDAKAKQAAIKDLQKKYAQFLQGQGFENRANIVDTEATRARAAALQNLLRRQG
jgi:hypothetical protein